VGGNRPIKALSRGRSVLCPEQEACLPRPLLSPSSCANPPQRVTRSPRVPPTRVHATGHTQARLGTSSIVLRNVSHPDSTWSGRGPTESPLCLGEGWPVYPGRSPGTAHLLPPHPGAPHLSCDPPFLRGCHRPTEDQALGRSPGTARGMTLGALGQRQG
jgi:hypothetical protein